MDPIRNRYNPEYFHTKALDALEAVSHEEAKSWFEHPCTQSLLNALEGDLAGIIVFWLGGGYASEKSAGATAQLQAKARGMAQAINDVIERIKEIRSLRVEQQGENQYSS